MHKNDLSVLEWRKSFMDLFNYLLFLKNLCIGRKICQFFSDSRASWLHQLLPKNLRKICQFFLSDSRAWWLIQLLLKYCVQERFVGSSWVIQELEWLLQLLPKNCIQEKIVDSFWAIPKLRYFFNYSQRIVFKKDSWVPLEWFKSFITSSTTPKEELCLRIQLLLCGDIISCFL